MLAHDQSKSVCRCLKNKYLMHEIISFKCKHFVQGNVNIYVSCLTARGWGENVTLMVRNAEGCFGTINAFVCVLSRDGSDPYWVST